MNCPYCNEDNYVEAYKWTHVTYDDPETGEEVEDIDPTPTDVYYCLECLSFFLEA